MRAHAPAAALLALAVVAVYAQVRHHDFVDYDDLRYVVENPTLALGFAEGVARDFAAPYYGNWIPLTSLSLRIDHALYGLDATGFLATNVALHGLATLLLFAALSRLTGAPGRSAFAAGVFALHPLHVESVAWVSERKDVLSGVFFMATLWAYALYAERPASRLRYAALALALALGLLAKPMLVTLPLVLLLLDLWPLGRLRLGRGDWPGNRALLREKLPLLALALLSAAITFAVQRRAGAVFDVEELPLAARIANAATASVVYLRQSAWPAGLAAFYPLPLGRPAFGPALAALALLAALTTGALRAAPRRPYLAVGWLWYLVTLLPVIGLVQVGMQAHADRYLYLPQIGLGIALAWGAVDALGSTPARRRGLAVAGVLTLVALGAVAWRQVGTWRDSLTLHQRIAAVNPESPRSQYHLGSVHLRQGDLTAAHEHYARAVQLDPRWAPPQLGLANLYAQRGELARALALYERALALDPRHAGGHASFAAALLAAGQRERAKAMFERATGLLTYDEGGTPMAARAWFGLADILWGDHELDAARRAFERGLEADPGHARGHASLGLVLLEAGRSDEAARALRRAGALGADHAELHLGLALVAEREGDLEQAVSHYRSALARVPGLHSAANNLAWILATHPDPARRDPAESIRLAEGAARALPDPEPELLDTLAAGYAAAGRFEDAAATAQRALGLAQARGDAALAETLLTHLALYERRTPLREEALRRPSP